MKRYLVFVFDTYYPLGGMSDCKGDFDTLEECEKCLENNKATEYLCNFHIWDVVENKMVKESS